MSSNETFRPYNQNICDLLTCNAVYTIPNYQRQYTWGKDKEALDDLWNDLYEAFKDSPKEHYFLGSMVVIDDGNGKHEVVDGQQRLTTLMILFNVLVKTFPEVNKNMGADEVQKGDLETINSIIYVKNSIRRLRLQVDPNYDADFQELIVDKKDYAELEYPSTEQLKKDIPKYKFTNAAKYFYDKLNELVEDEGIKVLGEFVNYILYKTDVIKIICDNESLAIRLFLVLNDRGTELMPSDIVKSYILNRYAQDEVDPAAFNADWKRMEKQCSDMGLKIDELITFYEYYRLKENPKRQVTEELGKIIKRSEDIEEFTRDLRAFADSVAQVYASTDPALYSLLYIPWQVYVITALASAYRVDYPDKEGLFKAMRRFFYLAWVGGKTLSSIKQTSFNLIAAIVEKKPLEDIEAKLDDFIEKKNLVASFEVALGADVYGEKFLKPLLLSLDYAVRGELNTNFYKINKKIHADHILPKKFANKPKEWPYMMAKKKQAEAATVINHLGNMALLLDVHNKEALNNGFKKKIAIYMGGGKGGRTVFETTNVIIDAYNRGATKWTLESIDERHKYLMGEIRKMLGI